VALVRLTVFVQLGLCAVAALGLTWLLAHISVRGVRCAIAVVLSVVVLAEGAMHLPFTRVPKPQPGSTWQALAAEPDGNALLLPIPPPSAGLVHAFLESTRMVLGYGDGKRTVNGTSGFEP